MGMNQPFDHATGWAPAARMLDDAFPLAEGSHADAADYLVQHDHLLVIRRDGTCTGLARPGQFVEADGDGHAPQAIVLQREGMQVEIEPATRRTAAPCGTREHRLQLLAVLAAG